MNKLLLCVLCSVLMLACKEEPIYIPKPRTFPKISFPAKEYKSFDLVACDFKFDYPSYSRIQKDKEFFDEDVTSQCWFDLIIDQFNGSLHCTHYDIKSKAHFESLVTDAFELVGKHHIKADFRDEFVVAKENQVGGVLFELQGPVASPIQFFLTDSTSHFLRGALYFNNQVAPDSMAPVHDFIKQDVLHLIETFEWL